MKKLVNVKHPVLSVGQLQNRIRQADKPVRRSTHLGNQPAHELYLQVHMPTGIDILAVDTVRANDQYSNPRAIRLETGDIPLASNKAANLMVGKSHVREDIATHIGSQLLNCVPIAGESLQTFHTRALTELSPNNMPIPMSTYFSRQPELYRAVMNTANAVGEGLRSVDAGGKITQLTDTLESIGIFGLSDATPNDLGALPSLNTMMAMEMLLSTSEQSDSTLHLAGPDMVRYTQDAERMARVGELLGKAAAEVGLRISSHHFYEVADITGLGRLVPAASHVSQHELLRSTSPSVHAERSCAGRAG